MKRQPLKTIGLLAMLIGLGACQTANVVTSDDSLQNKHEPKVSLSWQSTLFTPREVASVDDIFQLTQKQQEDFEAYYFAEKNAHIEGHERLYNYLDMILYGFDYRGDTYTASDALTKHSGNCLSLAILTTALANLVDLDIRYQRVNAAPIYQRYHNVMTLSSHVRTHVFAPETEVKENEIVVARKKMIIDYFPEKGNVRGDFLNESQFLSMYYQNLAGDSLIAKDYDLTYSLLAKAMEINSEDPETLNTLAVLYKNLGDLARAEKIYHYALNNTSGSVNILSNYAMLLTEQNRQDELSRLQENLSSIEDDNPYRWYDIANRHFDRDELIYALRYFKRSVKAAPYLHEGYFGLAKTYYQMGKIESAKQNMDTAVELTFTPQDKVLYQAKLKVLAIEKN
ncbi:tetratricopeptide repeat protein [Aliiglaciecola sp. NS0011-25]|uniref:tetratricopeptide repeat protein n=1 Tax=Aliiglaciecola sp. NS0011-25 TaxID=3127654 RepID=UPI00310438A6